MNLCSLIFLVLVVCSVSISGPHLDCVATEIEHDDLIEEDFDFRIPHWEGVNLNYTTDQFTFAPEMTGFQIYTLNFCKTLSITPVAGGAGWSFGALGQFFQLNITIPPDGPHYDTALLEFFQVYLNNDGPFTPPCQGSQAALVNIYCGLGGANCTSVPGNSGALCVAGNATQNGYCLCSIAFTNNSLCHGLTFNILSNNCPRGVPHPLGPPPTIPLLPHNIAGIVIGTIIGFIALLFFGGYVYNRAALHKTGMAAVPFYENCTGRSEQYTLPASNPTSYGALTDQ